MAEPTPTPVEGHFDTVPDFANWPGHRRTEWTGTGWSNDSPDDHSIVVIRDQKTFDVPVGFSSFVLRNDGTLNVKTPLRVGTLVNGSGGQQFWHVGGELIGRDIALETNFDPRQWATGMLNWGRAHTIGLRQPTPFVQHDGGIPSGATVLHLQTEPTDWHEGDTLVLPDSRQVAFTEKPIRTFAWTEEVTIESVDGLNVHLTAPTKFWHPGHPKWAGHGPHVAHITRDFLVRSENPLGTRWHCVFGDQADVRISGVAFQDLGRTTALLALDSTRTLDDGSLHIGTNQIGRYACHFHHCYGPRENVISGLPQYLFTHNAIVRSRKWPVAIHGSHYGHVLSNVAYRYEGAGYVTEDGSETDNVIRGNIALQATGRAIDDDRSGIGNAVGATGAPGSDIAFEGSAFWYRGPTNIVEDNVAACCPAQGFVWNGYYLRGPVIQPKRPDWDHHNPAHYTQYSGTGGVKTNLPTRRIANNECYGIGGSGHWFTWSGGGWGGAPQTHQPQLVENPVAWHCMKAPFESWHQGNVTVINLQGHNDPAISRLAASWSRIGKGLILSNTYEVMNHVFRGGALSGMHVALPGPSRLDMRPFVFEDFDVDTPIFMLCALSATKGNAMYIDVRNIRWTQSTLPLPPKSPAPVAAFVMLANVKSQRVLAPVVVSVNNFNDRTFRVFWDMQASSVIVPQGSFTELQGYPEAGLTNAQGLVKYGKCIGGEIMPSSAYTDTLVNGGKISDA